VDEQVSRSLNTERILATLSGSFGTARPRALTVGLYGVMSYVVTQRTREIGIRLALGATRASALGLVIRDALVMIVTVNCTCAAMCPVPLGRLVSRNYSELGRPIQSPSPPLHYCWLQQPSGQRLFPRTARLRLARPTHCDSIRLNMDSWARLTELSNSFR